MESLHMHPTMVLSLFRVDNKEWVTNNSSNDQKVILPVRPLEQFHSGIIAWENPFWAILKNKHWCDALQIDDKNPSYCL